MAEDQSVNGDRWTTQAAKLFSRLGWNKIGDCNIDVPGADGICHGIDSLFTYEDGYLNKKKQGIFLEAKRYKTESFAPNKLSGWVQVINNKVNELKQSSPFLDKYLMNDSINNNGVLVIWFHDIDNYKAYKSKFQKALLSISTIKRGSKDWTNRLFIMDNFILSRLMSLCNTLDTIDKENLDVNFYYASSVSDHAVVESKILNLELMFSDYIFMKIRDHSDDSYTKEIDTVIYYDELNLPSFHRLKSSLIRHNMISKSNPLRLYLHNDEEDESRKILPEVEKIFSDDVKSFELKRMNVINRLPNWLRE